MSVLRVMSTETEYGISVPGQPGANAMVTSSQIVNAYQAATAARARRARWDFEEENPLRDARGFDLAREAADSTQLTDEDLGLANVILTNGARLYVDHAHPEYSAPECTNPLSVVIWDKAGERIMAEAAAKAATVPGSHPIQLYKNNTDNKGASYGTHENYLMRRSTPFADIVKNLTPFFVTRQVICGAGRVGIGADGRGTGFQISQRADFFEVEVGLETTLKRPIINTRDEPHADPEKYRRLHVIIGDANMSEVATYLKMGTTALVLAMIEDKFFSHDITGRRPVRLAGGRQASALDIQREYYSRAVEHLQVREPNAQIEQVVDLWGRQLDAVESQDFAKVDTEIDWVIKRKLVQRYQDRYNMELSDPKIAQLDLAYHDIKRGRGVFDLLQRKGLAARVTTDEDIEEAVDLPPQTTRARLRGEFISAAQAAGRDFTVDWVHLKLNDQAQRTVLCKDPFRAVDERVKRLIASM